jgi:hypothetical protein
LEAARLAECDGTINPGQCTLLDKVLQISCRRCTGRSGELI